MSAPPYLDDAEVEAITDPLTQGAARVRFFKDLGCDVKRKPNGQPLVWRADFEAQHHAKHRKAPAGNGKVIRPDWPTLRGFKSPT